ncbi:MAG: PD-(D/E)XK nuclease family protein [Hylemonella sp.]|uniref:PD-(D/E)XK nuclease family protein n=1 Tax=Hylemonella sp. TaxID=2066020 RepID=UPI00391D6C8B
MDQRWQQWLAGIASAMQSRGAHPARTVVLLPYAQLMPQAARHWARRHPDGFAPRFETTQNWCRSLGEHSAAPTDYSGDAALDVLTARALLEQAGLRERAELATPLLLDSARELVALAAAVPPQERAAWGQRARLAALAGLEAGALALEAQVAQVAVTWLAHSSYPSDVLFSSGLIASVDCLVFVPGLQPDPLAAGLRPVWGDRLQVLETSVTGDATPMLSWHAATDVPDEAQRAAACVLRHLEAGRSPVAVAVIDRALTRRVRAMLASHGVQMRDETGWKLSTSRAGAQLMVALRAAAWNASSDAVLDWLKHAPACDVQALRELETALRRRPQRAWRHVPDTLALHTPSVLPELLQRIEAWRAPLQGARPLADWLRVLREVLLATGQWTLLQSDLAGEHVLQALRLGEASALPPDALWARRRLSLADFTRWVDQVLESASFKSEYPAQEQAVLLPLAQMLGRDFAAVVLPGCDEVRLPLSPEPAGLWTAAQRAALGLPAREALEAALRAAWADALARPAVDVLWRRSDEGGEPLLPSPLVQLARRDAAGQNGADPRVSRRLIPAPVSPPLPAAPALAMTRISASAYQDLRHCPYRYFALRQLGLKEAEEIEGELDKRDFGLWLHAVLQRFHTGLDSDDRARRRQLLDAAAAEEVRVQRLAEDEFLPFMAAWPRMREGYLDWLAQHEAAGWRYADSECDVEQPLGALTLFGRLDRIDRGPEGMTLLIDYKTEPLQKTRDRIREPLEDTQLAFYAALQPEDTLRAAYVNVGERDGCRTVEQEDVVAVRDALIEGLLSDLGRIAEGAPMPALGEGRVCETCAARGLCRRDFWSGS